MIKIKGLSPNIMALIPKAAAYMEGRPAVRFAYLFGGLAGNSPSPLSDVHIAIFLENQDQEPEQKLEILGGLADVLQTDEIDLFILKSR
jgi:predicted nucleotidyltransferase